MNAADLLKQSLTSGHANLDEIALLFEKAQANQVKQEIFPLHWALKCTRNSVNVIKLLLKNGANVNKIKHLHGTPLHFALLKEICSFCVVKALLDNGAEVNAMDALQGTPLHCVLRDRRINVLILKMLLDRGADVNMVDPDLRTPLHHALHNSTCSKYVIELLLKNGADVNMQDFWKFSPLHFAVQNKNVDHYILKMLLARDANVTAKDYRNQIPLLRSLQLAVCNTRFFWMLLQRSRHITACACESPEKVFLLLKYTLLVDPNLHPEIVKRLKTPVTESLVHLGIKEREEMEKEMVGCKISLLDFLLQRRNVSAGEKKPKLICIDSILKVLSKNKYWFYREVIEEKLTREDLLNKLEEVLVLDHENNSNFSSHLRKMFTVNMFSIASFLSDKDLLNLVIAFALHICEDLTKEDIFFDLNSQYGNLLKGLET